MRKLLFLLVALLTPILAGAQRSPLATAPSATAIGGGLEQASLHFPEPRAGGPVPSWCTNRSDSYCTYAWNWGTRCCYPTYVSPGAYCPEICE